MRKDSLVLYKTRPARVTRVGKKLQIELEGGESLSVRPKDVVQLHRGPLHSLDELQPQAGEVETAWELLAGSTTTLAGCSQNTASCGTLQAARDVQRRGTFD